MNLNKLKKSYFNFCGGKFINKTTNHKKNEFGKNIEKNGK